MAAQDEGQVPFGKLPLAELKNWIEDWLDLPPQGVIGGIGGGSTTITTVQNISELGFMREQDGILVPRPGPYVASTTPITLDADALYYHRFVCPRDMTITAVRLAESQQGTGVSKIGVGIWASSFATLLASSVMTAAAGGSPLPAKWTSYALQANQALTEGTEYVVGVVNDLDTGSYRAWGAEYPEQYIYTGGVTTVASQAAHVWGGKFNTHTTIPASAVGSAGGAAAPAPLFFLVET